ncbi:DUF3796 domain-containing protein [Paucisalibacillus globulus]|uniref:DUF3796 domain-containing protein n=1 Tax=Paucisalibacillus globulus TaxID=351095 RepID=UPI00041C5E31|nr:DUF3796 domain-containing protein [Paucisalibacillus globulus]
MFSESFLESPWVILILIGNYLFLLALFYIQRRVGKKNYRYDERYYNVHNRAKGRTWDIMLVIMLIANPIVIIFDGIKFAFFFLNILYILHVSIWGFAAAYYDSKE